MGGGGGGGAIGVTTDGLGNYTFYNSTGGTGGFGWVLVQYDTGAGFSASSNGSRTIPNGISTIKVWALGCGGGGGSSSGGGGTSGNTGGGGGAGGMVWKTWTWGPAYYPTKPVLA